MKFSKILVPVTGAAIDDQAVRLACQAARSARARVLLVHVIEVRRTLPLESENVADIDRGEQVLTHADQIAHQMGVQAESELLQARAVAPVLLDLAADRQMDLIVMGVPYHPPLDEFRLGTTVREILKTARCQVWLCREQAEPEPDKQHKPAV